MRPPRFLSRILLFDEKKKRNFGPNAGRMIRASCTGFSVVLSDHDLFFTAWKKWKKTMTFNIDDACIAVVIVARRILRAEWRVHRYILYKRGTYINIYKPSSAIIEIQSHGRKGLCENGAARVKSTRPCSSLSTASKIVCDNDSLIDDHRTDFGLK